MTATNYTDSTAFKSYAGIPSTNTTYDSLITAVTAASFGAINQHCGRVFATSTGSRVYEARCGFYSLEVDDISSATGVTISHDTANDAAYDITWASTDYELRPLNGLLNGVSWPYTQIRAVGNNTFPISYYLSDRAHVQVQATWGWPSVPSEVVQASYILSLDLFKMKDAPFGTFGGNEFGAMRIRENNELKMLLGPYRKNAVRL